MKKLFTICFFIATVITGYAQNSTESSSGDVRIQFKRKALATLQMIAFQTNYDTIIKYGEYGNIDLKKTKYKDGTESLSFKLGELELDLLYSKNKKLIFGGMESTISRYDGVETEAENLVDNNFTAYSKPIVDKIDAFKPSVTYYNKKGYPYEFIIRAFFVENYDYIYIFNKEFGSINKFIGID